jgi:hypothetical protein
MASRCDSIVKAGVFGFDFPHDLLALTCSFLSMREVACNLSRVSRFWQESTSADKQGVWKELCDVCWPLSKAMQEDCDRGIERLPAAEDGSWCGHAKSRLQREMAFKNGRFTERLLGVNTTRCCVITDKTCIVARQNGSIDVINLMSAETLHIDNELETPAIQSMEICGDLIIAGCVSGWIRIISLRRLSEISTFKAHARNVEVLALSNELTLFSGSTQPHPVIKQWNTTSWECVRVMNAVEDWISCLVVAKTSGTLIYGTRTNGYVHALVLDSVGDDEDKGFEPVEEKERADVWTELDCEEGVVSCLCLSDDERFVFTGGSDHQIRVWDMHFCQLRQVLFGHRGHVTALASRDSILVSGGSDCFLKFWHQDSGECFNSIDMQQGIARVLFERDRLVCCIGNEEDGDGSFHDGFTCVLEPLETSNRGGTDGGKKRKRETSGCVS